MRLRDCPARTGVNGNREEAIAIYSLNIRSIGKTTHAARTAGAHIRYIARPDAQAEIFGARMPTDPKAARRWLDQQERDDRKNARVIDKITLALPRELSRRQRRALVEKFGEILTAERASWLAAIHQDGEDTANPHAHLVIRDRDFETGTRVAKLSEKGACDRVRLLWETAVNDALVAVGSPEKVDRRSYAARGIETAPQRHRGPEIPAQEPQQLPPVSTALIFPPTIRNRLRSIWGKAVARIDILDAQTMPAGNRKQIQRLFSAVSFCIISENSQVKWVSKRVNALIPNI